MNLFKKLFSKEEEKPINSYQDFWDWFLIHEKKFFKTVKKGGSESITNNFFDIISPKLNELKEEIWYLTGMSDSNTVELVLTSDGNIQLFYLIEELVKSAPNLKGWKFSALKPEHNIENVGIKMGELSFSNENIFFYSNELENYPDEIDITVVHLDLNEENQEDIMNGSYLFIDNYLGELNSSLLIDNIEFENKERAKKKLIPIEKLKSFITWREKEFVEKYEGLRRNTKNDTYSSLEATLKSGNKLIAVVNSDLLEWNAKGSHPWLLRIEIKFDGDNNGGFPDKETYSLLNQIENDLMSELKDFDGYLNIGRETANNLREIHFACKDFRKPCKITDKIMKKYLKIIDLEYVIYRDKYWRSLERFQS